ncbi:STAS domain-containing protein [Cryptosporangium minutisporangium]|uniref:STAS domain-containing protein n=1 Tax=Cryptosporangium minutisporangium TaxID=113569 RepID=A0ABP6T1S1_9ACTN
MTSPLQITTDRLADGKRQLTVTGEIDLGNAAYFKEELGAALQPGPRLLVDLTGVEYLDSAALAVLFTYADRIEIRIAPLNEYLLTVCGLTQLTDVEVVRPDPSSVEPSE